MTVAQSWGADMRTLASSFFSLRAFQRSAAGNIAILTALMLVPVMGIAGLAVDYSISSLQHSRLTALADSTALLGARRAKALIEEGARRIDARLEGRRGLERELTVHFTSESSHIKGVKKKIEIDRNGQEVAVTVDWNVQVPSVFGKLFGQKSYQISGRSKSTVSLRPYVNLIVLLDISQSMGIGATQADQARLFQREGCMFACHLPVIPSTASYVNNTKSTYQMAREASPPIDTRVDIGRSAIQEIITLAEAEADGSKNHVKIGVYTFSNTVREVVPIDKPIASDFDEIRNRVKNITLGQEGGGSNIMGALNTIHGRIRKAGDGSSSDNPKVFVLLVSDGVANSTLVTQPAVGKLSFSAEEPFHHLKTSELNAIQSPRSQDVPDAPKASQVIVSGDKQIDAGRMGAMDDRICEALKSDGVTMMVVAAEYVIPGQEHRGKHRVDNRQIPAPKPAPPDLRFAWFETGGRKGMITDRMRECASKGYFVSATDGAAIKQAIAELGASALRGHLRLTD
jgi:hypothetical protein